MEHEVQNCEMSRVYNYTQYNDTSVNKHLIVKKGGGRGRGVERKMDKRR